MDALRTSPATPPVDVTFTGAVPPPERPPVERALPETIGRYVILGELGRGGHGVVYRGFDPALKRPAAVKVLLSGRFGGPDLLFRFRTEAEVVARLDHPHIVRVYEVGEADGSPFLALELVDGPTLARALAEAPLAPKAAAALVETLARAVAHAHANGVVHRDLKPGNVLLAVGSRRETVGSGQWAVGSQQKTVGNENRSSSSLPTAHCPLPTIAKIADFGLAKDLGTSGSTVAGEVLGTPSYMAPEQAAGDPEKVGPPADVWALGAILYECLTGRPPFRAATAYETFDLVRLADPVSPRRLQPSTPRDLEVIAQKCLEKDPARRYVSAAALADDLARFGSGQPILARPVGPVVRAVKWVRRHPSRAALFATALLTALAGVAGVVWHNVKLQAALDEVTAKKAEVAKEKDRADENYRQARAAIDRILGRFRDRDLSAVPRLRDLQRKQAEDALTFFRRIAEQTDETPEVRYDVARALAETGRLHMLLGHPADGERDLRGSIDRLRALAAEFPAEPRFRIDLGEVLNTLGSCRTGSDPAEAQALLTDALGVREALRAAEPGSVERDRELGATHGNLGNVFFNLRKFDAAARHYLAAAEYQERAAAADPAHRRGLVKTLAGLAVTYQQRPERIADATRAHDRAEAILEQLVREDPADDDPLLSLAILRLNWAYVLAGRGAHDRALADLAKNVRELEPALRREPDHVDLRDALYRTHGTTANVLETRSRWADAAGAWRKCVEYSPDAQRPVNRLLLALALAKAGDHAAAAAEIEGVLPTLPVDAGAELFTHSAIVLRTAREKAPAKLADKYAARAVELLARAKAAAGPKGGELIREVSADPGWWPILARSDAKAKLGLK